MLDLTGHTDIPVPEEVLAELADVCGKSGTEMFVIGAASMSQASEKRTQPPFSYVCRKAPKSTLHPRLL